MGRLAVKKFVFVADSPASIASIVPLINNLDDSEYHVLLISPYSRLVIKEGITDINASEFANLYRGTLYDEHSIIIYGTGSGHPREIDLPLLFPNNFVIAIHDLPTIDLNQIKRRRYDLPNAIITPNEQVAEAIDSYLGPGKALILGNPNFDMANNKSTGTYVVNTLKPVFVSSPNGTEFLNDTNDSCKKAIQHIIDNNLFDVHTHGFHICLHPRETSSFLESLDFRVSFSRGNTVDYLNHYEIIVGVDSTCLIESMLLGNEKTFRMIENGENSFEIVKDSLEPYHLVTDSTDKVLNYLKQLQTK